MAKQVDDNAGEVREITDAVIIPMASTPWLDIAQRDIGLEEIAGPKHNPRVVEMFAQSGHSWVVDDETAWCAAAMCAWLEEAGVSSPKTLSARAFEKWGQEISEPVPGCIVVMWRGSPYGWQGHVGIYLGDTAGGKSIRVLGGNQSNRVSVAEFSKRRRYRGKTYDAVLSYRMPRKVLRTQIAAAGNAAAALATAVTATTAAVTSTPQGVIGAARPVADALVKTGTPAAVQIGLWMVVALSVISLGVAAYTYWRRGRDFAERGV